MSRRVAHDRIHDDLLAGDLAEVDPIRRREAILRLARDPVQADRPALEDALWDHDPRLAFTAWLGLRRLHPPISGVHEAWLELFGESVRLLETRAASGPVPLRLAAMQALAFAPGGVFPGVAERWRQDLLSEPAAWGSLTEQPPALPLMNESSGCGWFEMQGLLLAAMSDRSDRVRLLRELLEAARGEDAVPVFLALQLEPEPEITDLLLPWLHTPDVRVAIEAARAILACGGSGVYVLLLAQIKQAGDPAKLCGFLAVLAQTGREEAWQVCRRYLAHADADVRLTALEAVARFPRPAAERREALRALQKDDHALVAATAVGWLWRLGALESVSRLTSMASDAAAATRQAAARALALLAPGTAIPLLVDMLEGEKQGDVLRAILMSLRRLLPGAVFPARVQERLLLQFRRLLSSADFFRRSQTAVLCGRLGISAEDLILTALEEQEHPHVLASLLGAAARMGSTRALVFSRFRDHPDPRVRANLMEALLGGGAGAVPFLSQALRDPSPRVRSGAAQSLFALGQFEVIGVLNRMLLTPSPLPVLAACHALGRLMRLHPPALAPDHPLRLHLGSRVRRQHVAVPGQPVWMSEPMLPELLQELSHTQGEPEAALIVLHAFHRRHPASRAVRRLTASFLAMKERIRPALALLESCLRDQPGVLADQFDAYRLSLLAGDLPRAEQFGRRVHALYRPLLDACREMAGELLGHGKGGFYEQLHALETPSLNLYNAMIQLKSRQGDRETVLELLGELFLARPTNPVILRTLLKSGDTLAGAVKAAFKTYLDALK